MPATQDRFGTVYTVQQVARSLRVDTTTVRRWCKNGALKKGEDFFTLPRSGKLSRDSYRFTETQYNRLVGNPPVSS